MIKYLGIYLITNPFFYFVLGFLFVLLFVNHNITSAHPFIKNRQESAMPSVTATGLSIAFIVTSSALLFSSGIFFNVSSEVFSSFFAETGRFILEGIIQNTIRMSIDISGYLDNSEFNLGELRHIHGYLTPYIRSYDTIFRLMMGWVNFFDASNSEDFHVLEEMQGRYRVAGNDLLEVYRRIETLINVSIQDSPIGVEDWEYV